MVYRIKIILVVLTVLINLAITTAFAQEAVELKTASRTSYTIQKYTGFNFLVRKLYETSVKSYLKIKMRAQKSRIKISSFSGIDLLMKKAKKFTLNCENLRYKKIPLKALNIDVTGPIYIKRIKEGNKRKSRLLLPVSIKTKIIVDLNEINEVIKNLPKWKNLNTAIDLPLPPFGSTKIKVNDIDIMINNNGEVSVISAIESLENEKADPEPIYLSFTGRIGLEEKKILIKDLKSSAKDIFTKDSDIGREFSKVLEDLINPVFNFAKYEKKGLTIESVNLNYEENNLILDINAKKIQNNIN